MNVNCNEEFNIFAILPFFEDSQLVNKAQKGKLLHLLNALVAIAIEGLNTFIAGRLIAFDAQVGENLCQLRAYHIFFLTKKLLSNSPSRKIFYSQVAQLLQYKKDIKKTIYHWDEAVSHSCSYEKNFDKVEQVKPFLERNKLLILLNEDVVLLTMCYFLARFSIRQNNILYSICLEKIAHELEISKSQAKKLTRKYQAIICKLGYNFISQVVADFPEYKHYRAILPSLLMAADDARFVLPCYAVSYIIFHHALKQKAPIFLSVHRIGTYIVNEIVYFLIIGDHIHNPILTSYNEHLHSHCIAIEAEVNYGDMKQVETTADYVNRLLQVNPIKSLLANTAMHPQYSGERLKVIRNNPFAQLQPQKRNRLEKSFKAMQTFSLKFGCHQEKASTLLMKHAYSSSIMEQINSLRSRYEVNVYDAHQIVYS